MKVNNKLALDISLVEFMNQTYEHSSDGSQWTNMEYTNVEGLNAKSKQRGKEKRSSTNNSHILSVNEEE